SRLGRCPRAARCCSRVGLYCPQPPESLQGLGYHSRGPCRSFGFNCSSETQLRRLDRTLLFALLWWWSLSFAELPHECAEIIAHDTPSAAPTACVVAPSASAGIPNSFVYCSGCCPAHGRCDLF